MKIIFLSVLLFLQALYVLAGDSESIPGLIPKPQKLELGSGWYEISSATAINWNTKDAQPVAQFLQSFMTSTFQLSLQSKQTRREKEGINFIFDESFEKEAYELSVTKNSIIVRGSASGLFYGLQTVMQLMPAQDHSSIRIPQLEIQDKPRFAYRGTMLDVGRYFFSADYVKHFIDLMAFYKLNVLHWHLTEDAGWRIEIKKYPLLTQIGAWRRGTQRGRPAKETFDRLPHGGYYTQEQIRDIVAYAQQRQITIIPEIDMPGHTLAALAAYPEISCTGGPFKVLEHWGIQHDVMCAGNEATYTFVEGVLDEVMDLFPSTIIHVGGDEAPKDRWEKCPKCQAKITEQKLKDEHELQSYFITRLSRYLESKGRRLIGWDEILEGGLASNAMVMSWRGEKGGIAAAKAGHEVVMSPSTYLYIDYGQDAPEGEPYTIGGNLPLEKVYHYEPLTDQIEPQNHKYIIGLQGNLWMEFIHGEDKLEYMGFPRMLAVAETGWSARGKDYADFTSRLKTNLLWLEKADVNFRIPKPYGLKDTQTPDQSMTVELETPVKGSTLLFTLNGEDPLLTGKVYTSPITIQLKDGPVTLQCVVRTPKGRVSGTYSAVYKQIVPGDKN